MRKEIFEKKNNIKGDFTFIRKIIHEDEFILTEEEIERMEINAKSQIEQADKLKEAMNEKLLECEKMRKMLNNKN